MNSLYSYKDLDQVGGLSKLADLHDSVFKCNKLVHISLNEEHPSESGREKICLAIIEAFLTIVFRAFIALPFA